MTTVDGSYGRQGFVTAALPEAGKERVQAVIQDCGLPPAVRGEKLTLEDFARLAAALQN